MSQNPEKQNQRIRVLKNLTASVVLVLSCSIIFFSQKTSSQSLPDCSTISGTAQQGANCFFFASSGISQLCQAVPSASYFIPSGNILTSGQQPRVNCADLIDLPLCGQINSPNTQNVNKNCVRECSDPSFSDPTPGSNPPKIRGIDYAVHNRDCIRFCDAPESGVVANSGVNCIGRKCHQLLTTDCISSGSCGPTPAAGSNCSIMPCNLLTPDELNDLKFGDDTKQYCDGTNIKCYKFTQSQLPYVITRSNNTMCKIHDCRPASPTCGPDDTLNVTNQGTAYTNIYQQYINGGYDISTTTMCNQVICQPVVKRQLRCSPQSDPSPTIPDPSCDSSGPGATCNGGYCYKTIDCNLTTNSGEPECITSSNEAGSTDSGGDTVNSWFYRPVPMDKATSGGILLTMEPQLCYTMDEMQANGWGNHVTIDFGLLGTLDLGYFHDYLGMDTRSPGYCGGNQDGSRGTGYIYLCGPQGLLYNKVDQTRTAFYSGYVNSTFKEGDADHRVNVCLRFNNLMIPESLANSEATCGSRECGITIGFSRIFGQVCGRDVCEELLVTEKNPDDCMMSDDMFDNNPDKGCSATIDTYLRLRAVKYTNRICAFLDVKGQLAYDSMFMDGSETLSDGTCLSGTAQGGSCSGSKNSNDSQGLATKWRAMIRIPYILNNQPSGSPSGFLDRSGAIVPQQECINIRLRISPPRHYNLANITNSSKLFAPPIYIVNSRTERGGPISPPQGNNFIGKTDFHFPEVEVRFGATLQKVSLGVGFDGYETTGGDPLGSATVSTTVANNTYSVEIFVRKEFDPNSFEPTFCLYRRVKDINGTYLDPLRIQCVSRVYPDIDNSADRLANPLLDPRRAVIYPDATNAYNNAKIDMQYLAGFGPNNTDDSCGGDDLCSGQISLDNPIIDSPNCSSSVEQYRVCAKRDDCTKLNVECIKNEIDIQNAKIANQPIDSFLAIRKSCNEILLPMCNLKKGITVTDPSATIIDQNPGGVTADPTAYGWFNEICISSGFETKLKKVLAYQMNNGTMGKCIVDSLSPYLTDGNPATNCDAGGEAPNCLCIESIPGVVDPNPGELARTETAHEAGLCVDIPVPQLCPIINYNLTPNPDTSDPQYVIFSLNNNAYGTTPGTVYISHQYRTFGKSAPNPIPLLGHAEFPIAIIGMNNVEGECNGFWKDVISAGGIAIPPKLNCLNNSGNAQWDSVVQNPCIRYNCPQITTTGPDQLGVYQGNYGALETGENKGLSNGFATWPQFLKTNDFLENVTATSCITGFKTTGATTQFSAAGPGEGNTGNSLTNAALYDRIIGYNGGTLPTRNCNQLGQWNVPGNFCQRIACPAINPPTPTGSGDTNAWALWQNSAGATYPSVNASRSTVRIQNESVSVGTCNNTLGFFQSPGGNPPTRECDYLGNWLPVQNPCVTQCDAIATDTAASNINNGFALWNQVLNVPIAGEADGVFNRCVSGYVLYPYPPLNDKHGNAFPTSNTGPYRTNSTPVTDTTTPIPNNVSLDTRTPGNPQRVCESITTVGGQANVWSGTSSSCINACPGFDTDPRIGVGKTQHPTSTGTVTVNWSATNFNTYQYLSNVGAWSAANFTQGRTNGHYILRRFCNPNGTWSAPEVMCDANGGQVGNATYNIAASPAGIQNSYVAGSASTVTGVCVSGYWKNNKDQDPAPQRQCVFESGNSNIDKVYWALANGTQDCKQYCQAVTNQVFNTSNIYTGSTALFDNGEVINLVCQSGYGQQVIGGFQSTSSVTYACGVPSFFVPYTDRSTSLPYAICSSGSFGGVFNSCSACRSCDAPANTLCYTPRSCTFCVSWPHETIANGDSSLSSQGDCTWTSGVFNQNNHCDDGNQTRTCYDGDLFYWSLNYWNSC